MGCAWRSAASGANRLPIHPQTAFLTVQFSLLTLIGAAFPQRNEVRTHLCLGSTEIAQWIVRAASALSLQCTYVLIHRYSCLLLL